MLTSNVQNSKSFVMHLRKYEIIKHVIYFYTNTFFFSLVSRTEGGTMVPVHLLQNASTSPPGVSTSPPIASTSLPSAYTFPPIQTLVNVLTTVQSVVFNSRYY